MYVDWNWTGWLRPSNAGRKLELVFFRFILSVMLHFVLIYKVMSKRILTFRSGWKYESFSWFSLIVAVSLISSTELAAQHSFIIIRAGAEVTLPCDQVRDDHVNCGATTWSFSVSQSTRSVKLFVNRQLDTSVISRSKADRLRLAANCSLVIREVTAEDAGRYICRQFDQTGRQYKDHNVYFSVVNGE